MRIDVLLIGRLFTPLLSQACSTVFSVMLYLCHQHLLFPILFFSLHCVFNVSYPLVSIAPSNSSYSAYIRSALSLFLIRAFTHSSGFVGFLGVPRYRIVFPIPSISSHSLILISFLSPDISSGSWFCTGPEKFPHSDRCKIVFNIQCFFSRCKPCIFCYLLQL